MKKILSITLFALVMTTGTVFADIVPTVRASSSRSRIAEVQSALNQCSDSILVVDGVWGSRTTRAVRDFQRDNGIAPVGFVGSLTAEALNDCLNSPEAPSNPSNSNTNTFNNTNTTLCPNGATIASNCTVTPNTSTTNQVLCPNGALLISNCTVYPNNNNNSNYNNSLSGVEGTLVAINRLGAYNNTKVYAGERDVRVLGLEFTARDADQRIEGITVSVKNTNTNSNSKITRYASDISIWMDGVEIGRKQTNAYSDETGDNTYVYRFTNMNGIARRDQHSQIVIAVTGASNIDSIDADNDAWSISLGSSTTASGDGNFISAMSPNGRYRDYGNDSTGSVYTVAMDFQKAGGSNSAQRYRVYSNQSNPLHQTVQVSRTTSTNNQLLLSFDAKAENAAMILQRLPITLTATSSGSGVAPNVEAIVQSVQLYINGEHKVTESISGGSPSTVVTFGNYGKIGYLMPSNQIIRFEIRANLQDVEESTGNPSTEFDEGDMIRADYTPTNVSSTVVELDNFYQDSVNNRSGSVAGQNQILQSSGVQTSMGQYSSTYATNSLGEIVSRTITIPFTISAFDDTAYVSQSIINSLLTTGTSAVAFTLEDESGATKAITGYSATFASIDASVENGAYRIDAGSSRHFIATILIHGASGNSMKQYRIQLNQVQTFTNSLLNAGANAQTLTPSNAFETDFFTLNLN